MTWWPKFWWVLGTQKSWVIFYIQNVFILWKVILFLSSTWDFFLQGEKIILGGETEWVDLVRKPSPEAKPNGRSPRSTNWMRHRPASWPRPEGSRSTLQEGTVSSILVEGYVSKSFGSISIHIFWRGYMVVFRGEGRGDLIKDGDQGSLYRFFHPLEKVDVQVAGHFEGFPLNRLGW